MSLEDLDLLDKKILAELDKNARVSYSELGKRIRIAKETVKYRMQLLEKKGIVQGYYAVIDFSKLGYTIYRLYLKLSGTTPEKEREITEYLTNSKQVAVFLV